MRVRDIYDTLIEVIQSSTLRLKKHKNGDFHCLDLSPSDITHNMIYTTYVINKILETVYLMGADSECLLTTNHIQALLSLQHSFFKLSHNNNALAVMRPHLIHSKILLVLAQILEKPAKLNRYQILFPSIEILEYEASSTSLLDTDLKLQDFVLSDDGRAIIEVVNCLLFAECDGNLKHTYLLDGQPYLLSEAEKNRVVNHSVQTRVYWNAISKKIHHEQHSRNVGAVLTRLADSLTKGGAHGRHGGTELDSGADANVGIYAFFEWFDALDENEKNHITGHSARRISDNLGMLFNRLRRPHDESFKGIRYCVELISHDIQQILKENPALFDFNLRNKQEASTPQIDAVRQRVTRAHDALKCAIGGEDYIVNSDYSATCNLQSFYSIFSLSDLKQYAHETICCYFTKNRHGLIEICSNMRPADRIKFIENTHGAHIRVTDMLRLVSLLEKKEDILSALHIFSTLIVESLKELKEFENALKGKILHRNDISEIELINVFSDVYINKYMATDDLFELTNKLHDEMHHAAQDSLISKILISLLPDHFYKLFNRFAISVSMIHDKNSQHAEFISICQLLLGVTYANCAAFSELLTALPDNFYPTLFELLASAKSMFLSTASSHFHSHDIITDAIKNKAHLQTIFRNIPQNKWMPFFLNCKQNEINQLDHHVWFLTDRSGVMLVDWVIKTKHQPLMDLCYQSIYAFYQPEKMEHHYGLETKKDKKNRPLFYYAIKLNQPLEKLGDVRSYLFPARKNYSPELPAKIYKIS